MVNEKLIYSELNKVYNIALSKYNKQNILGVFTIGNITHGTAEDISEFKCLVVILPTFEELVLEDKILYVDEDSIEWASFPLFYQYGKEQNSTVMEALFSDYYIITEEYKTIFEEKIKRNAEEFYRIDKKMRLYTATTEGIYNLELNTPESLMEAARLDIAINLYETGASIKDCVTLTKPYHISYLLNIKNGNETINRDELFERFSNYNLDGYSIDEEANKKLKNAVLYITRLSIKEQKDVKVFLNKLTEKEKLALKTILEKISYNEGSLSLSKVIGECGVSRPVFMGLIQKMKDEEVAEIRNMGVKGTYFNITSMELVKYYKN